ncbi:MAG: translation elongation factor 4 [Clostridia bacterium]|nr:translation elongation factor 4 [Clostridia bacterium]
MSKFENIRNFCIVAHIDHGKSTLADRLIEYTGTVAKREMSSQLLDSMELEKERGITIKLTPTTMKYKKDGKDYILNLIDTPGHVDFTYEVSRSLAACEGAILIVDASQGVEAQTLANLYLAVDNNLEILPVINKIDLPSADIPNTQKEIEDIIGIDSDLAPCISAKEGTNINQVLDKIVDFFPAPQGEEDKPLKALIFDSYYDNFKGAICLVRIFDGELKAGDKVKMMNTGNIYDVTEVGIFVPKPEATKVLKSGEVGYMAASIKVVSDIRVGDTITNYYNPTESALPGYKEVTPMVFSSIFPADGSKYQELKDAIEKLKLNDASLTVSTETSKALGFGFRCGFLGLLHMEIIQERLEREFNLDIITTAPGVSYIVHKTSGETLEVSNPINLPKDQEIDYMEEPYVLASIYTPPEFMGAIMGLCQDKRGNQVSLNYVDDKRVNLEYEIPLNEIIYDFFDKLKSYSKGYASLDYKVIGYRKSKLVRLDILLKGEICDALSVIVFNEKAYDKGRAICEKLKEVIPRQMFEVPIQATIGAKIIARETVKPYRKDVISKCYGGDVTRKRKLLEKQKEGKKRMRQFGSVEIPSEAFTSILKI